MTNEIKEILECLEKYGQLTLDAIDDLHYIRDYITNLQDRIDKAVEYLETHTFNEYTHVSKTEYAIKILRGDE